jgi:hypothetical protein
MLTSCSATWLPSAIAAMLLHVQTNNAPNVQNCQRLEDLLRILNLLKERFSGAEFVSGIAEALMQALPQKLIKGSSWKESTSFMAHIGRQPVNISDETKAGALNWALEFIAKCFIFKKI